MDLPDLTLAADLLEEIRGYDGKQEPEEGGDANWSLRYHPNSFKMRTIGGPARNFPPAVVDYELVPSHDPALVVQLLRAAAPADERFIAERIILRGGGPVDDLPHADPAVLAAAKAAADGRGAELPEYDWSPRVWRRGGEKLRPARFVADLRLEAGLSAAAPPAPGAFPRAPKLAVVQPVEISTGWGVPLVCAAELEEEERGIRVWEEEMDEMEVEIRREMEMQEMSVWGKAVVEEKEAEEMMLVGQNIEAEMAAQEMDAVEVRLLEAVWSNIAALKARGALPRTFGVVFHAVALSG